ncbi:MAG TPA: crosslink repair DNA glycosylase YcaQ family protein [Burkholderiales bacterium]|nr:crosslink repair DNA glycosylase YcaQ family protein [Burkholderiales bacterium]
MLSLSLPEARRLAVASQGFASRPARPTIEHLRQLAAHIHAFQIDSVNVLARAHYVSPFARLGPYPAGALDVLAYEKRELFEYWGHAACLLPISLYPLFRYRMDKHREWTDRFMHSPRGAYMAKAYAQVAERGPIGASELSEGGKRSGNWWGWSIGKLTLEHLYDTGLLAIAGRRGFERLYDISERVIPKAAREAPVPNREAAMKALILLAAKAYGVGTLEDLRTYFYVDGWSDRSGPIPWRWARRNGQKRGERVAKVAPRLVAELVEDARLVPARVDGWKEPGYVLPGVKVPAGVEAAAFVTPFDSLVWDRARLKRVFGMDYTIEIYTPMAKRKYGYYVFPFVLGDKIVARCDLKADRERGVLIVRSAHLEPGHDARRAVPAMARELETLRTWLALDRIEVADRGTFAASLRRASGAKKALPT